jgi:hypothetical protein
MALTSTNASTNALANYTSLTNNTAGSAVKDNSSKTQETQSNTAGTKPATSSPAPKVQEAQSPAVVKSISPEAWNASNTPNTSSTPSYAPAYDTATAQPAGRSGEVQSSPGALVSTQSSSSLETKAIFDGLMAMFSSGVFQGSKNTTASQSSVAADSSQQRASREAIAAYSGTMSLNSAKSLADFFAAPRKSDEHILVAANDSKWPNNGGPAGDPPDVRLRMVEGSQPVSLDLPEGSVRDIGLTMGAFIGGSFIAVHKKSDVKQQLGITDLKVEAPANPGRPGKLGGVEHREGVALGEMMLKQKYGADPKIAIKREVKVDTPNGTVATRYLDIAAVRSEHGQVVEGVQVGKLNAKSDVPVSRERTPAREIAADLPSSILSFIGYNR